VFCLSTSEHLHHVLLERMLLLNRNADRNLQAHVPDPSEIRTAVAMQPAVFVFSGNPAPAVCSFRNISCRWRCWVRVGVGAFPAARWTESVALLGSDSNAITSTQ
jgi:hypothetical protein